MVCMGGSDTDRRVCDLCVCVCVRNMYVCTVGDCGSDCVRKLTIHRQLLIVPDLLIICY